MHFTEMAVISQVISSDSVYFPQSMVQIKVPRVPKCSEALEYLLMHLFRVVTLCKSSVLLQTPAVPVPQHLATDTHASRSHLCLTGLVTKTCDTDRL